jgi:3-hydroxyisobutyrate dehydrogenase-like beta-hydroxyacid dehydrogenase
MTYGFVGLGQMGQPMAARLTNWPGGLIVYDSRPEAMAPLTEAGATAAASLAEVAAKASIVSVMVRDDEQVREVVQALTAPQASTAAGRRLMIAIHSTIAPLTAIQLSERHGSPGLDILDAPVSGGAMGARDGRLVIMVGGDRAAYEQCREPFGRFADLVLHMGPVGAGTKAKLARNLLHFVAYTAAAEAQRLAEAAGLDLRKLAGAVRHSDAVTGGPGSIMVRPVTAPMAADDPLRPILDNARALGEKDLALALELGEQLGVDLPMARYAIDHLAAGLGLTGEQ